MIIKWKHFPRYWPLWGESTGGFSSQRSVMRSFGVFFDLRLNRRLSKQSGRRWFETPSRSLWRHCNDGTWACSPFIETEAMQNKLNNWDARPHGFYAAQHYTALHLNTTRIMRRFYEKHICVDAFSTSRRRRNGHHVADDFSKYIFNENSSNATEICSHRHKRW